MRKRFYSLLMLVSALFAIPAMADEVTFDFANNPWGITPFTGTSNTESNIEGLKEGVVTISCGDFATASGYKAVLYTTNGKNMLFAAANAGIVLTADEGYVIKQIVFNMEGTMRTYMFNPTNSDVEGLGTISAYDTDTKQRIWTAGTDVTTVSFKSGTLRVLSLVITVEKGEATGGEEEEEVETHRLLVSTSTYGDALGETSTDVCTAKKLYYYDPDLNIQAVVNNKTDHGGLIYLPVDYNSYQYNEAGQLTSIDVFQYGAFEYLQRGMKESATSSTFEYDEAGNMIKKTEAGIVTTYEYDADGNIIKESISTGKTVEYSDFSAGKNKYAKAVSTHVKTQNEAEFYDEEVIYDEKGNKTEALRTYNVDNVQVYFGKEYGHHVGDFLSYEKWEYDEDGIMTLYVKSVQQDELTGEFLLNTKTAYEPVDGNKNMIRRTTYDAHYIDDEVEGRTVVWSRRGTPFVDEYLEFTGIKDLCKMEIEASVDANETSTVNIAFALPELAEKDNNMHINVYRGGEFLATIPVMQISSNDNEYNITLDTEKGKMIYSDKHVKNGKHEYFITAVASNSIALTADGDDVDGGMGVTPLELTEYCASNKVTVEVNTPLPKAINLKAIGKETGSAGTSNITISFDYEEGHASSVYGFKESFVVINGGGYPDDPDTDANAVTNNASVRQLTKNVENGVTVSLQIATRYTLGVVLSDPFVFNPSTVVIDGIENVEAIGGEAMYYDLQGRKMNKPQGVTIVKQNGKVTKQIIK